MSQDISKATVLDKEKPQPESVESPHSIDRKLHDVAPKVETDSNELKQEEHKHESLGTKVEEQLDEAQGLLNTAVSTGQSKEARLARVCAGLSTRLQEYKSENAQLEELLMAERELSKSYEGRIKQLEKKLSATKGEVAKVELNMSEALDAKNSEIAALVSSMDMLRKQAALSEGNLASIQANMESIMRNKELTETRMMQALREELASAERRAEEERAAHNATKMAAMEREVELEHRGIESSTALARVQRIADDRTAKAADLEQKLAVLEVEYASLNQEMQDMETRAQHRQKKSPEDANQMIQIQAWKEEVERARQSQRDAESKLSSVEAEMQKLRVEMAAMKRDAEHYSRQEHMELEKRYRELTDLLYYKQTQLETMASEKAAVEFQLEKEIKSLREAQVEASRSRVSRRQSATWEEDADMKALEPLPIHQRHMAGASVQLQKAAKILDTGAARATRFLWRYPTARLILLFYLVFVHLFLMYLLHCLQEQADTFASREVAETMGLGNFTQQ
ncbi:golgin candidate 1 [Impatiens glandulifera]|uniref:golgin candidate 1 n=1 Tax=Impatiens glandulifera TaxID=253017 RepID=UPI001FB13F74|nr:golgin candidate 1 [Impatiens glandulifera]